MAELHTFKHFNDVLVRRHSAGFSVLDEGEEEEGALCVTKFNGVSGRRRREEEETSRHSKGQAKKTGPLSPKPSLSCRKSFSVVHCGTFAGVVS